jgi:hypothetical protein
LEFLSKWIKKERRKKYNLYAINLPTHAEREIHVRSFSSISSTTRNNEKAVEKNAKGAESEKDTNNTRSNEIGAKKKMKKEVAKSRVA